MIWVFLALAAAIALAPFAFFLWRGGLVRDRRDAALALHQAQLTELDRDLAEGRILPAEHAAARLEVQRRLLADAAIAEGAARRPGIILPVATAVLVPAAAIGLYLRVGAPHYDADVAALTRQQAETQQASNAQISDAAATVSRLRAELTTASPGPEAAWKDNYEIGRAELTLNDPQEALSAWQSALNIHFDPGLGAATAELMSEIAGGKVTPEAAKLFRRALAEAPPDVPWRKQAEKRVSEAGGS